MGRIGGVAIYSGNSLGPTLCQVSNGNRDFELLWVRTVNESGTVLTVALYHPPRPCYKNAGLYDYIERSLEELLVANDGATVVLA